MRILVTNDDGIHAPGLASPKIARALTDDVWVVAPETEQSGASHSLTLTMPLRLRDRKATFRRHRHADGLRDDGGGESDEGRAPDLVLSGVNRGSNIADDVTYSGTIAGAMEGCALGIPSIALSQAYGFGEDAATVRWDCGETHGPGVIEKLVGIGWPATC
jgi:5'/3'-nucleotidase SurE